MCYERPSRDPGGKGPPGGSHGAAATEPETSDLDTLWLQKTIGKPWENGGALGFDGVLPNLVMTNSLLWFIDDISMVNGNYNYGLEVIPSGND